MPAFRSESPNPNDWPGMMLDLTPTVEVKVLDARLEAWGMPRYQSAMAAAIDLHACIDEPVVLAPGTPARLISSGIAIHMANPHMAAVVAPRSGLGHKKGLVLGNLQGVIDADYTGPVMISAWNRNAPGSDAIVIEPGERIAQMMFVPVLRPVFEIVTEFSDVSERGAGGFGSTGTGGAGTGGVGMAGAGGGAR
jgi:dUTP pyrophosphatase